MVRDTRPVSWIKAARKDFVDFPAGAQDEMLRALTIVAEGGHPDIAKPLKGFGSGILELAVRFRGDAYRVVYAIQLGDDVEADVQEGRCYAGRMVNPSRWAASRSRRSRHTKPLLRGSSSHHARAAASWRASAPLSA
jgi:Phage derived protein Gp49-like (DUF891)